jgi:hypothetical protein
VSPQSSVAFHPAVIIVVLRWYASNKLMFGAMPRKIPGVWGQSPQGAWGRIRKLSDFRIGSLAFPLDGRFSPSQSPGGEGGPSGYEVLFFSKHLYRLEDCFRFFSKNPNSPTRAVVRSAVQRLMIDTSSRCEGFFSMPRSLIGTNRCTNPTSSPRENSQTAPRAVVRCEDSSRISTGDPLPLRLCVFAPLR